MSWRPVTSIRRGDHDWLYFEAEEGTTCMIETSNFSTECEISV